MAPNKGKRLEINVGGNLYLRFPIKTHIIVSGDDVLEVVKKYVIPHAKDGDFIFISEKIVAISQGRAFPIRDIKASRLAQFLVRFVHKSPYGIGLGSPWTMELAIREVGAIRILFAAGVAAVTKPFGIRGLFYKICGKEVAAIDDPCAYTLPPYNEYAKLGPRNPNGVACELQKKLHHEVVVIDANDLGVSVLGKSDRTMSDTFIEAVFKDNPLGQSSEQTPLCLVRKV
ncbi:MAG: coenzyme F420-0:L-glutamate ligase [Parcubacteria group bacterium]|nr:coenzyme F420-0:L-glutamate ligase [Parcubacteria group bacterium]